MIRPLSSFLAASSGLILFSCDRISGTPAVSTRSAELPSVEPVAAPTSAPVDTLPVVDNNAALEEEIAHLKAEEVELRLQLQRDELEVQRAELERQRDELANERKALAATAASQTSPGAQTVRNPPQAPRVDTSVPVSTGGRDYQMFYEGLAPYGEWMETSEYGYVWQPTSHRTQDWRPYTKGRWADSDQGWTWISEEPFGWATYHYGRWALLRGQGWIWVPGDTWAPAWVSWRNNEDYVGWSPLPPETVYADNTEYGPSVDDDYGISPDSYNFMPVRHFNEPVYDYCRPRSENAGYFNLTISVTRIVIRSGSVNCGGPEPHWINSHLSRPMTRYRLDRDYDWDDRRDYRPQFEQDRLSCYTPRVRNSWNEGLRPSRLGGRLDNIEVIRRGETYRVDLARRYQEEHKERRERANVSLRNDTVRQFAERHGKLEKIRSQRDQLAERREERDQGEGRGRGEGSDRDDNSKTNKLGRGEDARQFAERQERTEAARKELKERQEEVTRLRHQRETSDKKTPESDSRGDRENQRNKEREESVRREQARQNESQDRKAEEAQRGNRENQANKEREESARREQARQNASRDRKAGEAQRGNRENQENKEREESARRGQARQNEARERQVEQQRRGQRESQAGKEREESSRRDQAKHNEGRERQTAEQEQRGNRERENEARREQSKQAEQKRPQPSGKPKKDDEEKSDKKRAG